MFPCLTYLERNVRVDCEFPPTYQIPGPYCEYRQDSRLVGSTYPNAVIYVSTEDRRRSNVSLVNPSLCRLTWAPLADEKPYTYTCRVYQGNSWKENSMAVHHSESRLLYWVVSSKHSDPDLKSSVSQSRLPALLVHVLKCPFLTPNLRVGTRHGSHLH
uniref:Si:ch211-215c18.3 n=1 Tax=Salarias fasciatus TaxID=181472 RepID=A0A672FB93_SALFA